MKYVDPDGKIVTNKTDDFIIARLEDPIMIEEKEVDTIVLAPGDKYMGKVDGTRDKNGNYTKISAIDSNNIDYSVEDGNKVKFDNKKSEIQNKLNDCLKKILNVIKKDKKLPSGSYSNETSGGKFLSEKWDERFKNDLGEDGFNDYSKAYQSDIQQKLRNKMVINDSEENK